MQSRAAFSTVVFQKYWQDCSDLSLCLLGIILLCLAGCMLVLVLLNFLHVLLLAWCCFLLIKLHTLLVVVQVRCKHWCSYRSQYLCRRGCCMALYDRALQHFSGACHSVRTEHRHGAHRWPRITCQSRWRRSTLATHVWCPRCISRHQADVVFWRISKVTC